MIMSMLGLFLNLSGIGAWLNRVGVGGILTASTSFLSQPISAYAHGMKQDGKEVYRFATQAMPKAAQAAAEKIGFDLSDLDKIVPHQANIRIIETAMKNMKLPMEKAVVNIAHHGNTSSASIPIALDEGIRSGEIKRGDKICLVGFGAGLTYAAIIMEY